VVLGPHTVFGAAHAAGGYGEVSLSADDKPYIPAGTPAWVRFSDRSGVEKEEYGSNFSFADKTTLNDDRWIASTYRPIPREAWEVIGTARAGDTVLVESIALRKTVSAKVTGENGPAGYLVTDYPAIAGDSASRVTTTAGLLVGFVSRPIIPDGGVSTGCTVVTPPLDILAGTTPAPIPTPPPPVPGSGTGPAPDPGPPPPPMLPPVTPEEAYANGLRDGRAKLAGEIKALLGI
jgi:hypothetical protein